MHWISKDCLEMMRLYRRDFEKGFLFGESRATIPTDNLKWAYINKDGKRKICWIDNVTNKAFESDGYEKTDIEITDFTFERWCTSFDL